MAKSSWSVLVGFLAYGLAVGLLTLSWLAPGRDALFPLNLPGYLLGEAVYTWAIRLVGDPSSPQAHFTIPWMLRTPQVVVPASVVFWGLVGAFTWVIGKGNPAGAGRTTEIVLSLLALTHLVFMASLGGLSIWGLAMLALVGAGLASVVGVVRDTAPHSPSWGFVTWLSVVGLLILAALQGVSGLIYALPALIALTLAAFLADRRRGRRDQATAVLTAVVGIAVLVLLGFLVVTALSGGLRG